MKLTRFIHRGHRLAARSFWVAALVGGGAVVALALTARAQSPTPAVPPADLNELSKTAYRLPSAFVTKVENVKTEPNGTVTGTFTIENREETVLTDLRYQVQILGPLPPLKPGEITEDSGPEYDRVVSQEAGSVLPNR
ncbi:MAG: hypothetical protein Q8R32_02375, partial [bacterium]|nr:hypothetical protein [bacterium]